VKWKESLRKIRNLTSVAGGEQGKKRTGTRGKIRLTFSLNNYPGQGSAPATSPETLGLLLRERRSVRKYKEDAIPRDVIAKILGAGRYAPTGSNSQNVNYLALTSPERILRLRNMTLAFYENFSPGQEEDSVPFCWAYSPAAEPWNTFANLSPRWSMLMSK
jgi:hypothetical protein